MLPPGFASLRTTGNIIGKLLSGLNNFNLKENTQKHCQKRNLLKIEALLIAVR